MDIAELYKIFSLAEGISTDTRKITPNCLFFALKGENFNGNKYASTALANGAIAAVIDEDEYHTEGTILVKDVLTTLQKLANYHRKQLNTTIISLTGSNGKTTTKELIKSALATTYKTVATQGNLNNHIGVPLTLLSITKDTEFAVVEMGANHLKEIELLCTIAEPDFGYITNFGKAHLEGFGSLEGVVKGKSELYHFLMNHNRPIFYNADDAKQSEILKDYPNKYSYSFENGNSNITLSKTSNTSAASVTINNIEITSNLTGTYNLPNIAAAILIASHFKIDIATIKKGIEDYTPTNNRSQILKTATNTLILDAYNANPTSMTAALENLKNLEANHTMVILGDMFELGKDSSFEHQNIINLTKELNFTKVITLGEHFYNTNSSHLKFTSYDELKSYLKNLDIHNYTILIKGSRGMQMERLLEILQ
ncbi:UDP-N-acetylmuramoyl-tripeptide--D-alanyl-D-alanine ligase [Neptunitalea lumnitzerae]|uniref:UDP-N-acetylmuramoyl-tripeptide--D-alanyl-D-alanine ligase n=1 Tax=Neptunitalea lumnitzerae TaxID=2965509 RepID=A0ABQ5MH91_9FLAO|nr:UDP-N-acetylmuramoyl-tripeptide--D-alanyl-D-alanine ligase [Neptunitalea sp. Y10]GLB48780.1 UDP-N-acetylmuramoyl-tripeptide--D-alanyl-D-alanine ligase [Neptunitalea sp. Y10]